MNWKPGPVSRPVGETGNSHQTPDPEFPQNANKSRVSMEVKDSNGNTLADGDSVMVIKDLKVKGTSVTLKRGTLIKNIRLTGDEEEIEGNAEKLKGLVLKTCFLKKA